MMSIPRLCIKNPELGEINGECCLCGNKTKYGFKIDISFSNNFTGFSKLGYGSCICEYCHSFIKNQSFRKKSWIASKDNVIFPTKLEIPQLLLKPPEPPFAIYITKSRQKQGWLNYINHINYSRENFFIITDFAGCINTNISDIREIYQIITFLREQHITKNELLTGNFHINTYNTAISNNFEDILNKTKVFLRNPLWELLVYVSK